MSESIKHFLKLTCLGAAVGACLLAAVVSALYLWQLRQDFKKAEACRAAIKTTVITEETAEHSLPLIDWAALTTLCPDSVAWLWCPDTPLNNPIVQAADNDYYLTHTADRSENRHGAIFLDCHASPQFAGHHTLIYGHNMTDGSMFHALLAWQDADYRAAHPCIYILTPETAYEVRLFSGYETEPIDDMFRTLFTGSDFIAWQDALCRRSAFPVPDAFSTAERVVTFCTCTDSAHRFVLHGALSRCSDKSY